LSPVSFSAIESVTNFNQSQFKIESFAGHHWLLPVILATQEAEIQRIVVLSQPGKILSEIIILEKTHHKKSLVEWLKV
jgi:hypothetical protein